MDRGEIGSYRTKLKHLDKALENNKVSEEI